MRLLIAGSRSIIDKTKVFGIINSVIPELAQYDPRRFPITAVISGGARGVDRIGEKWCRINLDDEPIIMKPDYERWGRYVAPKKRNTDLVNECDAAIVIWDGISGGSLDTTEKLIKSKKPFWFFTLYNKQPEQLTL